MPQNRIGLVPSLVALMAMAACDAGGLRAPGDSPFAPGVSSRAASESVDGLIVGHNLMAAGEYELALRAYYRAAAQRGNVDADILSAVGSAQLKLGRLGQAEDTLRKAVEADENFVPAWNNLGVVLMERGQYGEASLMFKRAFALDGGTSDDIQANLTLALAKLQNPAYVEPDRSGPALVRRGAGEYLLLTAPDP
ncbi:tetratricopeptide repeat protein [Ovoidimarina sediminis]|uniref:tetratricopeptide repeat protein n=1 Tax=Ovoidimarina sediminis TaxID=3079856 RepID=UPI00290C9657|nr:tetratricopeptide repeat protein [Rhodophyticola sp. MJ-SS7]MDU8942957.1 tetratricopeptide repeat protein [Rhodophyticola sp. MJ-SS7]